MNKVEMFVMRTKITDKMAKIIYSNYTREHVLYRDKALCVHCGKIGLDVHHIIHRSQGIFPTMNPQNCVCICRTCHTLLHSKPEIANEVAVKSFEITKKHYTKKLTSVKDVLKFFGIVQ